MTERVVLLVDLAAIPRTSRGALTVWLALVVGICGHAAAQEPSGSVPPANPYTATGALPGSGVGRTIGYISAGDGDPFTALVTQGILEEAAIAGVDLVDCHDAAPLGDAVACALGLRSRSVQGVLNGQGDPDMAAMLCSKYGDVPTIAIDRPQHPCESALVGADGRAAGRLAGEAVGSAIQQERGCAYDVVVTLDPGGGDLAGTNRVEGLLGGFGSICGAISEDKLRRITAGTREGSLDQQVAIILQALPSGGIVVVLSADDQLALDALVAARALGRDGSVRIGALGAVPTVWPEISCNPSWIADTALFPERYGRTLIPAMVDLLDGRQLPPRLAIPLAIVSSDTIWSYYPDIPAC